MYTYNSAGYWLVVSRDIGDVLKNFERNLIKRLKNPSNYDNFLYILKNEEKTSKKIILDRERIFYTRHCYSKRDQKRNKTKFSYSTHRSGRGL